MKTKTLIITAVVAAVGLGTLGLSGAYAHGPFGKGGNGPGCGSGYGMMQHGQGYGPGMMQGQMGQGYMGHGQMGQGYGPGMMQGKRDGANCPYGQAQALATPLTVDDVRANLEQHLQWRGNDRLKVGAVTDKDDKTIVAEIVTVDDSLVRKIEIDKATGQRSPAK